MTWLSLSYAENAIGADQVYALGLSTAASAGIVTDRFTQYELLARGRVIMALSYAGYPAPLATLATPSGTDDPVNVTNAVLRDLAAAVFFNLVYELVPGIEISDSTREAISLGLNMLDAVYKKKLGIPGLTASPANGYGGTRFNTSPCVRPVPTRPIFQLRGTGF